MIDYEPKLGESIQATAKQMCELAQTSKQSVRAKFNDIVLFAAFDFKPEQIVDFYNRECRRREIKYLASDEYKEFQEQQLKAQQQKDQALKDALSTAPANMTLAEGRQSDWESYVAANTKPYGKGCVDYAERWARLMESRIAGGETLASCAKETSHVADNEGITGFMCGCAVSMLARVWVHGEELRRWHNLDCQVNDEGQKANESGGVLNPALLTINA